MSSLSIRHLHKSFNATPVLRDISLEIDDGEFIVFVGPSGCGKSTMLRCIAGLEMPEQGEILIGGEVVNDVPPARRGLAMVFQSYALYPHMTVAQNMSFGLRMANLTAAEIDTAVQRAAKTLQIEHLLDRRPGQLSGGQRQRVAIGRAIVRQPGLFLFDEPLSNLDAALRTQMRIELARLHGELNQGERRATIIHVTHDQAEAMTLAHRIVIFNSGRIEQVGAPMAVYRHPANRFVAGFIGSPAMNFLDATVRADGMAVDTAAGTLPLPDDLPATTKRSAARLTLGLRPEHLQVVSGPAAEGAAADGGLTATLRFVEQLGDACHLHLALPDGHLLIARTEPELAEIAPGTVLRLQASAAHLLCFDPETGVALRPVPGDAPSTTVAA